MTKTGRATLIISVLTSSRLILSRLGLLGTLGAILTRAVLWEHEELQVEEQTEPMVTDGILGYSHTHPSRKLGVKAGKGRNGLHAAHDWRDECDGRVTLPLGQCSPKR